MFPLNTESAGYVLKPKTPLGGVSGSWKSLDGPDEEQESRRYALKITVVSAYHLHRPGELKGDQKFNPFVTVELYGNEDDLELLKAKKRTLMLRKKSEDGPSSVSSKSFRTGSAEDNGFNPVWNEQWSCLIQEENYPFTFIRFGINTDESNMFGSCTTRIQNLNQGVY